MNHSAEHQLRELIRNVIREELKSRELKKDPETGIATSDLEDKEGKKVGYMKHKELPTGGFVAGGRIGPKAAEKKVDEETHTSSDSEHSDKKDEKKPKRRADKKSIEDRARELGQIEMFQEMYTIDEWANLFEETGYVVEETTTDSKGDHGNKYNKDSVDKAIERSNRAGRKIGKSEAEKIHRLLKGRHGGNKKD
jgi:hypothetical protein